MSPRCQPTFDTSCLFFIPACWRHRSPVTSSALRRLRASRRSAVGRRPSSLAYSSHHRHQQLDQRTASSSSHRRQTRVTFVLRRRQRVSLLPWDSTISCRRLRHAGDVRASTWRHCDVTSCTVNLHRSRWTTLLTAHLLTSRWRYRRLTCNHCQWLLSRSRLFLYFSSLYST